MFASFRRTGVDWPGTWLMPQSITTAPGRIQSPFTISGRPIATTRICASRTCRNQPHTRLATFLDKNIISNINLFDFAVLCTFVRNTNIHLWITKKFFKLRTASRKYKECCSFRNTDSVTLGVAMPNWAVWFWWDDHVRVVMIYRRGRLPVARGPHGGRLMWPPV